VHLSEGYFCQIFKEATGKSAMQYLHEIRVEKAEEMLRSTTATVSEIADCCGFTDPNYFSRIFKKIKGVTPGSLRETKGAEE
jgi:two-component system response regulator YesN